MPILAGLMGALIAGLAEFFAGFVTRRVAVFAALTVAVAASWAALFAAVSLIVVGVSATVPAMVVNAFAFIFPSNLAAVVTGALAIEGAVVGFRLHMGTLRAAATGA